MEEGQHDQPRPDRDLRGELHVQVRWSRADEDKKDEKKKDTDKIEVETSLVYTAPKANPEGLLFRIKEGKLTSANPTKGTIFYDPKNGRIASADISITLKGDLTVTIGGTDTKVELNQEQKTTIKTQDTIFRQEVSR